MSQTTPDEEYTYVHPAFRDGSSTHFMNGEWDREIPRFWVAKYQAGFQASTTNAQDATQVVNASDSVIYSDKSYTSYTESCATNALSQDLSILPNMSYPVFKPLTYDIGYGTGAFAFDDTNGNASFSSGFRVVLIGI